MAKRYEELKAPRFTIEIVEGVEQIRIRPHRQLFLVMFLCSWLALWTLGGLAAMAQLFGDFDAFLLVWLCFWAFGVVIAGGTIAWQLAGRETISVAQGDLEIGYSMLGFRRHRLYRGSDVRRLRTAGGLDPFRQFAPSLPFLSSNRFGSIKFNYGGRTVMLAPGLDDAEAGMIVDRLSRNLPRTATE